MNLDSLQPNLAINNLCDRVSAFQCAVTSNGERSEFAASGSLSHCFHIVSGEASMQTVACTTLQDKTGPRGPSGVALLKMNWRERGTKPSSRIRTTISIACRISASSTTISSALAKTVSRSPDSLAIVAIASKDSRGTSTRQDSSGRRVPSAPRSPGRS